MLILCSNGLSGSKLLLSAKERMHLSNHRAALVVTADQEYKEKNYHVARCSNELTSMGLTVDLFDLDQSPVETLLEYDIVEFIGGNPFYLLSSIKATKAERVLRQLSEEKVLIGWSAAAFVFGPTLELVNQFSPEMNFVDLTDLNALNLTAVEVLPHYSKYINQIEAFEKRCHDYELKNHVSVIRLNDGDGVIIDDEEIIICRE